MREDGSVTTDRALGDLWVAPVLQDFVRESFEVGAPPVGEEGELRTIQVGELSIWIEYARLASLVVIIRSYRCGSPLGVG